MQREWQYSDLAEIEQLEKECFPSGAWNLQMLADGFLSDRFYGTLIEENGQIVAYGGMTYLLDEGEIQLIATAEMYRRCGRGSQILTTLFEKAKALGIKKLFLEVRVSNASAMSLYLSKGFRGVYARTRYYPDGEDALVMAKEL